MRGQGPVAVEGAGRAETVGAVEITARGGGPRPGCLVTYKLGGTLGRPGQRKKSRD